MAQPSGSSIQFTTVRDFQVWASAAHPEVVKVEVSSSVLGEFLRVAHLITHHCPELVVIPSSSALSGAERRPSSPPSKAATPLSSIPARPVASNLQAVSPRIPYRPDTMASGQHPPLPLDRPYHWLDSGYGCAAYCASPATSAALAPALEPFPALGNAVVIQVQCGSPPPNPSGQSARGFRRVWGELRAVHKGSAVLGHGGIGTLSLRVPPGEPSELLWNVLENVHPRDCLQLEMSEDESEALMYVCAHICEAHTPLRFRRINVTLYGHQGKMLDTSKLKVALRREVSLTVDVDVQYRSILQ
ncbi:hypothetical protein K466DRAFT_664090 [Polyporus arcularius HHB13444]|uniref:Uncharacterized protein n=1 Tax=Polyporus arcularius HHB13444 TaxID=1314778 RepID=A0A5C3P9L7_9APHY|nr:hypothetical protein K466DRAFT_664090 [Polyporus arcularius HHB13444]